MMRFTKKTEVQAQQQTFSNLLAQLGKTTPEHLQATLQ